MSGKTYEAVGKERPRHIDYQNSLPEWHQVRTETRWLWNVRVAWTRHYYNWELQAWSRITSIMGSHSYSCKNMAHGADNVTKSHGYDFHVASHEAVAVLSSDQHHTESISVHTMCTVFYLILPNAIMVKLPGSWRYLLSQSTMLGLLYLCSWPRYVTGILWHKEHGLVWRTGVVWILLICSCLICGVTMDGLVSIDKSWRYSSESNVRECKSGKTYETTGKERLRYIDC